MKRFPIIDLHQDLLAHLRSFGSVFTEKQTDFDMLKAADVKLVVATAFPLPPQDDYFHPITNDLIETDFRDYFRQTEIDPTYSIIKKASDVQQILNTPGAHGILMHIEGLNVISDTSWKQLQSWYNLGWRSLGPVWNLTNPLGGGTLDTSTGLSSLGRQMITWLQERRMIVDLAHMNQPTFWDAVRIIKGPLYISHGNTCRCCSSPRNYDDDQLRIVAERDGVVGVFFANTYVVGRGNHGTVSHVADHIDHLVQIMGIDHVALGTDFGGIVTGLVQGLASIDQLPHLWDELSRRGYRDQDLERIAWRNAARVLTNIL